MSKKEIHTRLVKAYEYLHDIGLAHTQSDFAESIGVRVTHLNNAMKGDEARLTMGLMQKIGKAYSDYINPDWLLTGEGQMETPDKSMRPHVAAKAAAGFMGGVASGELECEMRAPIVGVTDYDFSIDVVGDSMIPTILEKDCLACKIEDDPFNPPIGKLCVIDGREGAAVKIIAAATQDFITLHSFNPRYADYDMPVSDINRIARVVGLVRKFN